MKETSSGVTQPWMPRYPTNSTVNREIQPSTEMVARSAPSSRYRFQAEGSFGGFMKAGMMIANTAISAAMPPAIICGMNTVPKDFSSQASGTPPGPQCVGMVSGRSG
ncbi:hypothetical protein ACFFX0_18395 [Citricoccus parietis]|uniref:Uncharacterized protein n=1 Tax=Citricoccus parietis TaxID=592307 RepID=A0ABV5G2B3_9MICC